MVSTTDCDYSCFARENIAPTPPASTYIVYMVSMLALWWWPCIQSSVQLSETFCDRQVVGFTEIHEPVSCFISDPKSRVSNNIWFCFIVCFCGPVIYVDRHVLCWCVISFFLDNFIKLSGSSSSASLAGAQTWMIGMLRGLPRSLIDIIQSDRAL